MPGARLQHGRSRLRQHDRDPGLLPERPVVREARRAMCNQHPHHTQPILLDRQFGVLVFDLLLDDHAGAERRGFAEVPEEKLGWPSEEIAERQAERQRTGGTERDQEFAGGGERAAEVTSRLGRV